MQNFGGLCCNICLDYLLKPVTTVCGHSFCQYCLDQYFLLLDVCPVCQKDIRNHELHHSTTLCQFVESFVEKNHPQQQGDYKKKIEQNKNWKQSKKLGIIKVGMKIDVRDKNYVWCEGVVIRIISRVGQVHKFLKIQYLDYEQKVEQDLKVTSNRIAKHKLYTGRGDIPKYKQKVRNPVSAKIQQINLIQH